MICQNDFCVLQKLTVQAKMQLSGLMSWNSVEAVLWMTYGPLQAKSCFE